MGVGVTGLHSAMDSRFASHPAAPFDSCHSQEFFWILDVAYSSGQQRLNNVDWTHLVLWLVASWYYKKDISCRLFFTTVAAARVKSEKPDRFFQTIDKISVIRVSDIWGKFRMCRYRIFSTTVSALTRRRLTILNLNIELRGMRKNPCGIRKLQIWAL